MLTRVAVLGRPQSIQGKIANRAQTRDHLLIEVVPLQRRLGDTGDRRERRPETVQVSLGLSHRHSVMHKDRLYAIGRVAQLTVNVASAHS